MLGANQIGQLMARGTPETPLPSVAGLTARFDFSDISTLYQNYDFTSPVTATGQFIGAVRDKSGNGYDIAAYLSGLTSRPTYRTAHKNGLSAAVVEGMSGSSYCHLLSQANINLAPARTIFVVMYNAFGVSPSSFICTNNTNNYVRISSDGAYWYSSGNFYNLTNFNTGQANIICFQYDTSIVNGFCNGSADKLTYGSNNYNITRFSLFNSDDGGSSYRATNNSYICEYLVYNSVLNSTDRATIRDFLNTKWAVY